LRGDDPLKRWRILTRVEITNVPFPAGVRSDDLSRVGLYHAYPISLRSTSKIMER
jgi:hypothetical protein